MAAGLRGRKLVFIGKPEETRKAKEMAEQKLRELLASALEIPLSYDEKHVLLTGGKSCILHRIRSKLQVVVSLQGRTLLLAGEPEKTKEASEIIERELTLV